MPTQNDSIWEGFTSSIFDDDADDISLNETPPASQVRSTIAEHRQILDVLFLIDVSGSMKGQRIAQVNYALENIFKELNRQDDVNSSIKIGIMAFSEKAKWVTPQPVPLEDYVFTKIEAQPWITCFGKAFDALNNKLRRNAFMNPNLGEYFAPLILFITDGEPVDVDEYPEALTRLKKNGWFRKSSKYAIAVGEEARTEEIARLLAQFTDVRENVRCADEGEALCDLIQFIAIRASEVQTSLVSSAGTDNKDGRIDSIFSQVDPSFSSMFDSSF